MSIKDDIREFTEKVCKKCNSYVFCAGELILSCKQYNKFINEKKLKTN